MSAGIGPRSHRATQITRSTQLASVGLAGWTAIWDRDTDVPLRLWGQGQVVSGSVADAAIAEAAARQFLAAHLATLAPGAAVSDFELVSNVVSPQGDLRTVGFIQRANGVRVLGGGIGVAFKNDRIAMVSSTALPNVAVTIPAQRLTATAIQRAATRWLSDAGHAVAARATANALPAERVIVPIVRPRIGAVDIQYKVAEQVAVDATSGIGQWNVWVDAGDATPIARRSTLSWASGKILYNVPDRSPSAGQRRAQPSFATHIVNGTPTTAAADGTVTWTGTTAATVQLKFNSPIVAITNKAGSVLTQTISLAVGGSFTLNKSTDEVADAQVDAFVYANQVKQFVKARINPTLAYLDQSLSVNVNENQTCNAFSTGDDIHFFRAGQCENTGRMADVVYHEFGHSLHANSIIEGVGQFDGSLSEGLADILSVAITGDPGLGRGFFFNNDPLRDLDPVGSEKHWPEDADGEVHDEGEIIGGTLWDLRKALETKLGQTAGYERWLKIYYTIMQRAADIPSSYAEALLGDDDDGDITNGTPNQCDINAVFGAHGLADPSVTLGIASPVRDGFNISIQAAPPAASACPGASVQSAVVDWNPRGGGAGGQVTLTQTGDTFAGDIPTQPDGTVVQYKVTLTLTDGTQLSFPNNNADPLYEFYVGEVKKLWCATFEDGAADWTLSPEFEAGAPMGLSSDPKTAFDGTNVLGLDLSEDGSYNSSTMAFAETPEIDLQGETKVRLQYQRWLGVEDGFYDQAKISANGQIVWTNFASQNDPQAGGVNHVDKEWRFQDVDLSAQAATGKVKLRFELKSDEGLEFGGWTMDEVCVVAVTGAALTCGNGTIDQGETCDDGNRTDGDGCSANCVDETGGGGDDGGCCSTGTSPAAPLALSLATLGLVLRRRRRA
ncbi:MAG TPA: hypothetical protein VFQ53_11110 [Kofleriaceae bacterium]|nr:hypothetical protein [Kofleriaceae bacterium]